MSAIKMQIAFFIETDLDFMTGLATHSFSHKQAIVVVFILSESFEVWIESILAFLWFAHIVINVAPTIIIIANQNIFIILIYDTFLI